MGSQTVSPSAAYAQVDKLPWETSRRQKWAQKRAVKAVSKAKTAVGLAEQVASLAATKLTGRDLKRPYVKVLRAWTKGITRSDLKSAASSAVAQVAEVTGNAVDKTLEILATPAGQAAVNAALMAAGLPPIAVGAGQSVDQALSVWEATTTAPEVAETDPELVETASSSSGGKILTALGLGATLLLGARR